MGRSRACLRLVALRGRTPTPTDPSTGPGGGRDRSHRTSPAWGLCHTDAVTQRSTSWMAPISRMRWPAQGWGLGAGPWDHPGREVGRPLEEAAAREVGESEATCGLLQRQPLPADPEAQGQSQSLASAPGRPRW